MTGFAQLFSAFDWVPIANCPGRFVLRPGHETTAPETLAGIPTAAKRHASAQAIDPVAVVMFDDGALLSYCKPDGRYVHTLNTAEGCARKFAQLGLSHLLTPS